jgi:vacuolar-type H+-ATPase subunit D/Vma8
VSYIFEKRLVPSQDVLKHYQRVQKMHQSGLGTLSEQKNRILAAVTREKAHIEALHHETEAREARIRETIEILNASDRRPHAEAHPPSTGQLRQIANTILREGLKFKAQSEKPQRIEGELRGAESLSRTSALDLQQPPGDNAQLDRVMEFQRARLSNLTLKKEDAKLKLETIMSNRDMLSRMIFDHRTFLETMKLKKQALQDESQRLEDEFNRQLDEAAAELGELAWKNAVLKSCTDIACMGKY